MTRQATAEHRKNENGSSVLLDSGTSRFDDSQDIGLNAAAARLRDYFGGGDEFADVLTELQSRYRPPIPIFKDRPDDETSESDPAGADREHIAYQLQCRQQIADRVAKAVECWKLVASLFAATVVLLEIAHLLRLFHDW
jgi:hypothetical protein